MKKHHLLTLLALGFSLLLMAQGQHITLDQPITGGQHTYTASESIRLLPGFSYKPVAAGDYFVGEIGDNVSQEVTPPTAGATGGPNEDDEGIVGATAGSFGVSETGQATYSIPLEFPGGIGGMTPDLSLIYNSNGGDGILGPGWSLGGLSVIHLVPANRYHDGIIAAAYGGDYKEDAYTLDGQRLIKVEDLGNDKFVFRTEQDVFSKITRKNVAKTGGRDGMSFEFEVKTKSGLTYYYGEKDHDDSRLRHKINDKEYTIAYYVNRIKDNFGNEINFYYEGIVGNADENEQGEIYIDYIEYTKNGEVQQPMYRIQFNYTDRHSPQLTYYNYQPANSASHPIVFKSGELISDIECVYIPDNSVVKRYELKYIDRGPGTNAANHTKHLASIQEFGLNGEEGYNKTVFEWEDEMDYNTFESLTVNLPQSVKTSSGSLFGNQSIVRNFEYQLVDFYNDMEIIVIRTYEWINRIPTSSVTHEVTHKIVIEFIKRLNESEFEIVDYMEIPYQAYEQVYGKPLSDGKFFVSIADFTGNGWNDVLINKWLYGRENNVFGFKGAEVVIYINNKNGTLNENAVYSHSNHRFYNYIADFNTDGIADLLLQNNTTGALLFRLGKASEPLLGSSEELNGETRNYTTSITIDKPIQLLDVNGDGRAEIVVKNSSVQKEICAISFDSNGQMDLSSKTITFSDNDHNFTYSNTDRKVDVIKQSFDTECLNGNCSEFNIILKLDIKHGHGNASFSTVGSHEISHYFDESYLDNYDGEDFEGAIGFIDNIYFADFNSNGQHEIVVYYTISLQYTIYDNSSPYYPEPYTYSVDYRHIKLLVPNSAGSGFANITLPLSPIHGYKVGVMEDSQQSLLYRIDNPTSSNPLLKLYIPSPHGSRIKRITNGMGAVTNIEYAFSSDPEVYTPGADVANPVIPYEANQVMVKRVERDNGHNGFFVEEYHYEKARAHTEGLGYLGFEKTVRTDVTRGMVHTTEYALNTDFYYTYPEKITISTTSNNKIKETENSYAHKAYSGTDKPYYYVHPESSTTLHYELGQTNPYKGERITYTGFDDYGNPGTVKTEYGEVTAGQPYYHHSTQVVHVYEPPDLDAWILGRLKTATTTFKAPDTADIIRKAGFEYYTSGNKNGMLKKEITEPDKNAFKVEKAYTYDDFGNILTTTIHAPTLAGQDRATTTDYKDGRFVEAVTNPAGHKTTRLYDAKLGVLKEETDPNGFTATIEYNAFGKPIKTIAPDGNQTASVLRWVQEGDEYAPKYAVYYSWSQASGAAPVRVYYNKLGMELSTVAKDFGGHPVVVETFYNNKGQVTAKTEPHHGSWEYLTIFSYDALSRVEYIIHTDKSQTNMGYNGLTTTTTNALGQTSQKTVNSAGWLIASTDAAGGKVRHTHYANGQVKKTYVESNIKTERDYTYDEVGNLKTYEDVSQGLITMEYNAFGELTSKTTPKGTTTYPEYDQLGRLRERILPNGEGTTRWEYDRQDELGLLYEEKLEANGKTIHKLAYTYDHDNVLRLQAIDETIDTENFTKSLEYDIFGRPVQQTFPSGYAVNYTYNPQGYQNKIIETGSGNTLWEAKDMNERMQFAEIKLGQNITQFMVYDPPTGRIKKISAGSLQVNNYTWDVIGNLKTRNSRHGIVEAFHYDELNRLLNIQHNGIGKASHQYDALGNITYKSDVGNYLYGEANKPYKLTSIDNRPATINTDVQDIIYNSYNKVSQITEKDPTTNNILRQLDLVYGVGNQRIMQQMQIGQQLTTKFYVGGDYEVEDKDGELTRVHYIFAPSGLAAIVRRDAQNNDAINYVLNDHLGSVQVLANAAGQLLEEFSYDPWGLRRDPITLEVYEWAEMPVTGMDYGFTGHEHLDIFMLVNMNGRMYDPVVGRFLTPDPVLQFPNYTQGLNPYAYALNNPLRFVDPDGYSLVGQLIAVSAQIALSSVGLPMLGVLAYSVIMTIDFAIENGRNVKAGEIYGYFVQTFVMSAVSMGATKGIGAYFDQFQKTGLRELGRAVAHGTFNGAMRYAQGGKFEHGFMSGFVSSLGGSFIQSNDGNMSLGAKVTMSAVIGGTAEKLGGGKFANGAVTGAYVMMFNHLMEHGNDRPFGQGEELLPNGNSMPNELDYKNREVVSVNGTDYILYDNQWHELMPMEQYLKYVENYNHPKGGVPWTREAKAIFAHDQSVVQKAALFGGTVGGASGTIALIVSGFKTAITPITLFSGTLGGQISAYNAMNMRMRDHDLRVDHLRNSR